MNNYSHDTVSTLLAFAESIANHSSGNLHGWFSAEVTAARRAVKMAGGTLKEIGRFRENESEPMSHEEYSRAKDERKVTRVLAALKAGPLKTVSDDVYTDDMQRVCTETELHYWIRQALKKRGHHIKKNGRSPHHTWTLLPA